MTSTREYILNLTMPEKVSLFKELYNDIAGEGMDGDTELAHVNDFEVRMLKSLGGSDTINEITGLREFKGGGSPPPPPASQSVTQTSEFPTELRPFVEDVLGEGRAEFQREKGEGFQAFPGPQLAAFTPEQQEAFTTGRQQFTGLAGTPLGQAATYYAPALSSTAVGTSEIGTEDIQRRMDPFLQNVVDIAKREARRDEDVARQGRAAQAVGAGSFGGSRQAIVEAEAERNLGERLADIQAQGLSSAFQNAQRAAEQQRARELTGGRQFAALGDITGQRARSDLAGLAGIGETQQQRRQQALDIAQREFEQERAFPQAALQRYASLIRGFPLQASQQRFTTETTPTPSLAQTLVGGLGTAAGLYGAFGGFNKKGGGIVSLQAGGLPGAQFNPGTAGGFHTTPMPSANQYPNPENVINALDLLRQRGASIRGLSVPQAPQVSLPAEIPQTLAAAEGGLMSVVKRNEGGIGSLGLPNIEGNTGLDDLFPTQFSVLDPSLKYSKLAEDQLRQRLKDFQTYKEGRVEPKEERDRRRQALLDAQKEMPEYWKQRILESDEARRREQWGNVAGFFGRLGTDVSPGAQVGGLRGLLGAGVSAGAQTVPEVLATESQFREEKRDLEDKTYQSNLNTLKAELDISEKDLAEGTAEAHYAADFAAEYSKALIDLAEVEEARSASLGTGRLKAADINSLSNLINEAVGVRFSVAANGKINIIKGKSYSGVTQGKINMLLDEALQHLQATGSIPDSYSLVQARLTEIVNPSPKPAKNGGTVTGTETSIGETPDDDIIDAATPSQ